MKHQIFQGIGQSKLDIFLLQTLINHNFQKGGAKAIKNLN